jgi:hypothetical protein
MSLKDILTGRHTVKGPAANDRLFGISTAYVTLETEHNIKPTGRCGLVFQPLPTSDFEAIVKDMEQVVEATCGEVGASVSSKDDSYGYRWMLVEDHDSFEDLVVAINAVAGALETGGYGERILCAVFAFTDSRGARVYFIYNYKRGKWYPFVPADGAEQRSTERELQIKALIGGELPIEPELERWFPLWGAPL